MNDNIFVVFVDTRAMYPSDIDGYEEHTCTRDSFDAHVLLKPRVKCVKSKVADLCGLDMKVYFHDYVRNHPRTLQDPPELAITSERNDLHPRNMVNGAASLLTFDPRTGFPEYNVLGEAYVVMDSGDYPLSCHQVWGIQDLISEARDLYYCDPEHLQRGRRQLLRWCFAYRNQDWGPLTIYEPRIEMEDKARHSAAAAASADDETQLLSFKELQESVQAQQHIKEVHEYYNHRHFPDCKCTRCNRLRYNRENQNNGRENKQASSNLRKGAIGKQSGARNKPRRWALFPREKVMCDFE